MGELPADHYHDDEHDGGQEGDASSSSGDECDPDDDDGSVSTGSTIQGPEGSDESRVESPPRLEVVSDSPFNLAADEVQPFSLGRTSRTKTPKPSRRQRKPAQTKRNPNPTVTNLADEDDDDETYFAEPAPKIRKTSNPTADSKAEKPSAANRWGFTPAFFPASPTGRGGIKSKSSSPGSRTTGSRKRKLSSSSESAGPLSSAQNDLASKILTMKEVLLDPEAGKLKPMTLDALKSLIEKTRASGASVQKILELMFYVGTKIPVYDVRRWSLGNGAILTNVGLNLIKRVSALPIGWSGMSPREEEVLVSELSRKFGKPWFNVSDSLFKKITEFHEKNQPESGIPEGSSLCFDISLLGHSLVTMSDKQRWLCGKFFCEGGEIVKTPKDLRRR